MSLCEKKLPNDKYDICNSNIIIQFYSRGFFFISTVQYLYIYFPKKMSKHKTLSMLNYILGTWVFWNWKFLKILAISVVTYRICTFYVTIVKIMKAEWNLMCLWPTAETCFIGRHRHFNTNYIVTTYPSLFFCFMILFCVKIIEWFFQKNCFILELVLWIRYSIQIIDIEVY